MIKKYKLIKFLLGLTTLIASTKGMSKNIEETEWQYVYNARQAFYEKNWQIAR